MLELLLVWSDGVETGMCIEDEFTFKQMTDFINRGSNTTNLGGAGLQIVGAEILAYYPEPS